MKMIIGLSTSGKYDTVMVSRTGAPSRMSDSMEISDDGKIPEVSLL